MKNLIEGNDFNFEQEVLNSDTPVLVDFWAPWCGPCRMVAPIIQQIADEYEGKLKVVKLNKANRIPMIQKRTTTFDSCHPCSSK